VLFCDTDAWATSVWEERYLGSASPGTLACARDADLYLLTGHEGVPFEDDGLRDGEHVREWMTGRLHEVTARTGRPVVPLTGPPEVRLRRAVAEVDALLAAGWQLAAPLEATL
jgi:nicotinamide riboside kinase